MLAGGAQVAMAMRQKKKSFFIFFRMGPFFFSHRPMSISKEVFCASWTTTLDAHDTGALPSIRSQVADLSWFDDTYTFDCFGGSQGRCDATKADFSEAGQYTFGVDFDKELGDMLTELQNFHHDAATRTKAVDDFGIDTLSEEPSDLTDEGPIKSTFVHDPPSLDDVGEREIKRLRRMKRNRESAAISRQRKKLYIEELVRSVLRPTHAANRYLICSRHFTHGQETKLAILEATAERLEGENASLRTARKVDQTACTDGASGTPPRVPVQDE